MVEALQYEFMRNALAAGLLASIICGIMGTLVVVNRIVFLSGGIAHAAYGGIGMAFFFGWPYLAGTLGFTLAAGLTMAGVSYRTKHRADSVIGVMWAVGMAAGIIFLDLTPGYNVDLMSYLFGSLLTVPSGDLWVMGGVAIAVIAFVVVYYQDILAMSYDEEFAQIRGVRVKALYTLLIATLCLGIVMIIQVVGLILVIAMLTIPPLIVEPFARSLVRMMALASAVGAAMTIAGLWLSYTFDLTSGASIILVGGGVFLLVLAVRLLIRFGSGAGRLSGQR
jgi:zinc transport system permease protein